MSAVAITVAFGGAAHAVGKPDSDQAHQPVTICHVTGNSSTTITVDEDAVATHLNHGDGEGACPAAPEEEAPEEEAPEQGDDEDESETSGESDEPGAGGEPDEAGDDTDEGEAEVKGTQTLGTTGRGPKAATADRKPKSTVTAEILPAHAALAPTQRAATVLPQTGAADQLGLVGATGAALLLAGGVLLRARRRSGGLTG